MKRSIPLLLALAWAGGCATTVAETEQPARGDTILSDFYTAPASLPAAGTLIRQETLGPAQSLSGANRNIRLLYTSTDGLNGQDRIAVSGAIFIPEGDAPEGGWPTIVWSHGTVGIGDVCAPSVNPRSPRDAAYLNHWLAEGYAVLASDYQGLGTKGTHPYMAARPMAYSTLDMIRAAQSGDFNLSETVLIAGQSQGASAAIAAAGFALDYAPELDIAGLMITGIPYLNEARADALLTETDLDTVSPNIVLSFYMLTLTELVDPDFQIETILSDKAAPVIEGIGDTCVWDFIGQSVKAGLTPRNSFTASYEAAMRTAFEPMQYPTLALNMPVFAGTGAVDQVTPAPMQQAFIQEACAAGAPVVSNVYPEMDHNGGLGASIPDATVFAKTVLSGDRPISTCPE